MPDFPGRNTPAPKAKTKAKVTTSKAPKSTPKAVAKTNASILVKPKTASTGPVTKSSDVRPSTNTTTPVAKKATAATTNKKTSTGTTGSTGTTSGGSLDQYATIQNGLTPTSTYTPVDLSGLLSGLNTPFDASATSALFDPQYKSLQSMRDSEKSQYDTGDSRLASMYAALNKSINSTAAPVLAAYNAAASNDATNGNTASQAIADAGTNLANQRQAMLQNLGIQAAAPGLNAADTATLQGQTKIQQAAGLASNLASVLGANANAYIRNTANNALQAGDEQRANLLQEYNNDSSTLDQKQADLDSAKAQALSSAQSAYSTAQSNAYTEYVKDAMTNALNASNAATAANSQGASNAQNLINNQLKQAQLALQQQSEAAKEAQNNQTNAIARAKLAQSANGNASVMNQISGIGISDLPGGATAANKKSVTNALALLQSLAGNSKNTYSNAAQLAAAVQKQTNNAKLNAAISDMAIKYWTSLYSKGSPSNVSY